MSSGNIFLVDQLNQFSVPVIPFVKE